MRALGLGLVVAACSHTPHTTWVDTKPSFVAAEARAASANGLVPVLYVKAPFTMASTNLVRWHERREMHAALDGIAVIAVDWNDLVDPPYPWHSFEVLDASGKSTGHILQPQTKDGPCTTDVAECAAWIEPFARRVR
jgi:hypothetical protein